MISEVIGKPYALRSNPPYSFNCWTLVTYLIPTAPTYDCSSLLSNTRNFKKGPSAKGGRGMWVPVTEFEVNDVILFGQRMLFTHAGLYRNNGKILHAKNDVGVVIESLPMLKLQYKNIKGYRWLPLT